MAISLTPGKLYFIRDIDYLTGEIGRYIKIGIVTNSRTTEQRMKDHQTGNPRGIFEVHEVVDVPFVERLETQIHYEYNEKWITGEWFLLDDKEAKAVYLRAEALKNEMVVSEKTVHKALVTLNETASNGKVKKATKAAKELETKLLQLKGELNTLSAQIAISKHEIYQELEAHGSIEGVVRIKYTPASKSFDEEKFEKAHPKIYKKYLVKKPDKWSRRFGLSKISSTSLGKINSKLNDDKKALSKMTYTKAQLPKVKKRNKKIEQMHLKHLGLLREEKLREHQYEMLQYELQVLVGSYEGIDGICTWPRKKIKADDAFDSAAFKKAEPEFYKKFCTKPRKEGFALDVEKSRAYSPK